MEQFPRTPPSGAPLTFPKGLFPKEIAYHTVNPLNHNPTNTKGVEKQQKTLPRILCVDDNNFVRAAICSILTRKGWDCKSAKGGGAALQWLAVCLEPIDILITDHQMPEMNGLEFIRNVRTTNFTGKILVWSATVNAAEQADYKKLNVDAFVPKSGNPELLLKTVAALQQGG